MPSPSYLLKPLIFSISILLIEWGVFPTLFFFIAFVTFLSGVKISRTCFSFKWSNSLKIFFLITVLILIITGIVTKTLNMPKSLWFVPATLPWAYLQEIIVFCFLFENIERFTEKTLTARILTSTLFAIFHLPNVFLFFSTFVMGMVFSYDYAHNRSVAVLGLLHFVLSILTFMFVPFAITHQLKVGIGYCSR